MWKRLTFNKMCEKCSYAEGFLIKRFIINNLQRNSTINYKAFADNLVLFSKDDVIMQN